MKITPQVEKITSSSATPLSGTAQPDDMPDAGHAPDGPDSRPSAPAYQRIKDYVRAQITRGIWKEGSVIPTELALCRQFSVSRMTVHRALRELTADQVLLRYQGSGTYVAPAKIPSTLIEIRSIAQDIHERGHLHTCQVLRLRQIKATAAQARRFRLRTGAPLFHSLIVHHENKVPIQLEDRVVDAERVPDYLNQDWSRITPNEYLMQMAPSPTGLYTIEVKLPTADTAGPLDIPLNQPCLVLDRATFSGGAFTSQAVMWYPGNRYKLAGQI